MFFTGTQDSIKVVCHWKVWPPWWAYTYLLTACPLCLLACRAATKALHSRLSWAILWIDPQVWWRLVISFSTVRRQVFLGRPRFLLPSGVQWRAVLVMSSAFFLKICPIHLHLLLISISSILSWWHVSYNSSLDIVLGQNIRSMRLKLLVWWAYRDNYKFHAYFSQTKGCLPQLHWQIHGRGQKRRIWLTNWRNWT